MKTQRFILHVNDPNRMHVLRNAHAFLDRLPGDKSWALEIRQYSKPRSLQQNKAAFGLAYEVIMAATGLEGADEKRNLHRDFCKLFFGEIDAGCGRTRPRRTTTTNEAGQRDVIDAKTMAAMYEFIQRKAAAYGIDVPMPDPLHGSES